MRLAAEDGKVTRKQKARSLRKRRDCFEWVTENQNEILRFASGFIARTTYKKEDALQIAYCCSIDAFTLWAKKKKSPENTDYKNLFFAIYKNHLSSLREKRTVFIEDLPTNVVFLATEHACDASRPNPVDEDEEALSAAMQCMTKAQQRIAQRIAEGRTRPEILKECNITDSSLRWHLVNMRRRIEVAKITGAPIGHLASMCTDKSRMS